MPLPLILAGPIARRLTSDSFAVWIATSRPTTATLSMWPGLVTAGVSGDLFDPGNAVAVGDAPSLRVGAQLHITLVVAHPPPGQQLMPGQRYSYNVVLRTDGGAQGHDLSTEGLLVDDSDGGQPALGYTPGVLPSVETCPLTLDELVLLHGSCNRIEGLGGPNLMPAIDTLIRDSLNAVPGREAPPAPAVALRRPGLLRRDRRAAVAVADQLRARPDRCGRAARAAAASRSPTPP